jgi:hypothetical protein
MTIQPLLKISNEAGIFRPESDNMDFSGSSATKKCKVYQAVDYRGQRTAELSRRERGFDSRWGHQQNQEKSSGGAASAAPPSSDREILIT